MPFDDLTFFLLRQLMKDLAQIFSYLPIEHLSAIFGDEDNVILAISPGMRQAVRGFGYGVLLVSAHQATRGELYSGTLKAVQVALVGPVAYLKD